MIINRILLEWRSHVTRDAWLPIVKERFCPSSIGDREPPYDWFYRCERLL